MKTYFCISCYLKFLNNYEVPIKQIILYIYYNINKKNIRV